MKSSRTRPTSKIRRYLARVGLALIGLLVAGSLFAWWRIANDDPTVIVPNPVMPHPNAFDFYVAAGRAVVGAKQIDDTAYSKPTFPMTQKQKEVLVLQNATAVQTLHQGFAYQFQTPPIRSFDTPLPYLASFRRVARLRVLQSQVESARGDWRGATDGALDAIQMGEEIPHGGGMLLKMNGIACQTMGQKALWETIGHLDEAQARVAMQRLQAIMDKHLPFTDSYQEEKWMGQAGLKEIFHGMNLHKALAIAQGGSVDYTSATMQDYAFALHLLYSKRRTMQDYTDLMDAAITRARQPYAMKLPPPPMPPDPIVQLMDPEFDNAWFREVSGETQNGLLLVSLALHAYRLEKGRYPTFLTELAPTYLKKLPDDPFAMRGSFVYRVEGEKFVLYSGGPDSKDDGGKPISDPKIDSVKYPDIAHRVKIDSVGDVVAGINLP